MKICILQEKYAIRNHKNIKDIDVDNESCN